MYRAVLEGNKLPSIAISVPWFDLVSIWTLPSIICVVLMGRQPLQTAYSQIRKGNLETQQNKSIVDSCPVLIV